MYRIVPTSLLLAAGIAVSACNVTTSSVTQPSNHGYTYAGGNDDKWEAEVQVASPTQLSSNNANWDSSPGGSGDTSGDNANNGNTNAGGQFGSTNAGGTNGGGTSNGASGGQSGGASDSSGEPDKDGPGATQTSREQTNSDDQPNKDSSAANQAAAAATAAADEAASRQNKNEQGELDKDGPGATQASSQPRREIVSAGIQKTEDGGRIAEAQYSDGTFSRDFFDADGNHVGSEGGTL